MLRKNRFRSSAVLRKGGVTGSDFYPVTPSKGYSARGLTNQLFSIVTGFCLYSKILDEMDVKYRFLFLVSKNKGTYPVTLSPSLVYKSSLQLNYSAVTGYFFDPVTLREFFTEDKKLSNLASGRSQRPSDKDDNRKRKVHKKLEVRQMSWTEDEKELFKKIEKFIEEDEPEKARVCIEIQKLEELAKIRKELEEMNEFNALEDL